MKYVWLEKMAEEGQISAIALEKIYANCSDVLENQEKYAEGADYKQLLAGVLGALGTVGLLMGAETATSSISGAITDARVKAQTDINKRKILLNPKLTSPKDKEKAEARFNEVIKFAPSLGANEAVMTRMVFDKLHTGLSNKDVQNLIALQIHITPDPLHYAAKAAEIKPIRIKTAASEDPNRAAAAGEMFANLYIGFAGSDMEKEGSAQTTAATSTATASQKIKRILVGSRNPSRMEIAGHILRSLSVPLAIAGTLTGASYISNKLDEKKLRDSLDLSFQDAVKNSPTLRSNSIKARNTFNTLTHFAPHIASEPNAARAFMEKLMAYETGPNASDLKDLTEVERNMRGSRSNTLEMIDRTMTASGVPRALVTSWEGTMRPYQEDLSGRLSQSLKSSEGE